MDQFSYSHDIGSGAPDRAIEEEQPGGMVINPHSALGKELRKWEQHRTELVPRGTNPGNPYVYRAYPRMLYKAQRQPNGQWACVVPPPHPYGFDRPEDYERAVNATDSFNRTCCRIVADESAERLAVGQGWCADPVLAMEQHEREEQALGNAAAEAAFAAKRMSEQARAEFAAAGDQTHEHVTDVVPARKRGRPAKGVVAKVGATPVED